MSPTARLNAAMERWHQMSDHAQAITMAGFAGYIIGRSYASDAISTESLAAALEERIEKAAVEEKEKQEREVRLATEADE